MPALVNSSVGSFCGTSGAEATTAWSFERKYSRNRVRMSFRLGMVRVASKQGRRRGAPRRKLRNGALYHQGRKAQRGLPLGVPSAEGKEEEPQGRREGAGTRGRACGQSAID